MADETTTTTTTETTTQAAEAGQGKAGGEQTTDTLLTGGKPEGAEGADGKPEGEKQTEKDAKPAGAPEKYEFTLPDGSAIDAAALGKFEPLMREFDLSQEKASKLVTTYAEMRKAEAKAQAEAWGKQVQDWGVAAKADKEIGGDGGAAFTGNIQSANKLMDKYGDPELKGLLSLPTPENPNGLGLGNHPALVRFMVRLAKASQEDTQVDKGADGGKETKTLAQKFYPDMNP